KERWLPSVLAGRAMASFAMTEPEAGSDAAAIATTARRDGTDYVLTGTKTLISNAGLADFYTVFASTARDQGNKGSSAFVFAAGGLRAARGPPGPAGGGRAGGPGGPSRRPSSAGCSPAARPAGTPRPRPRARPRRGPGRTRA